MVVIDEEEFNDLQAKVEDKSKFKKDKFYMKDMELTKAAMSEENAKSWISWLEHTLPGQFKRNELNFHYANSRGKPTLIPEFFHDPSIQKCIEWGEQAEARMKEAEIMQKKRRKDRLKLFDACLRQYLNTECNANHKIKYDI